MIRKLIVSAGFVASAIFCQAAAWSARLPRSETELFASADAVVVGEIVDIRIESERSLSLPGWGNYDWAVYCRLDVVDVKKGGFAEDQLVVRCQRPRYLRSFHCFGCSYHSPIPEVGQQVRAHLRISGPQFHALEPNGFTSIGGTALVESAAVKALPSGRYTFLLPLEFLIALLVVAFLSWGIAKGIRFCIVRANRKPVSADVRRRTFGMKSILWGVAFSAFGFAGQQWSSSFFGWFAVVAFITLIICTLSPPTSAKGQMLRWGVNVVFLTAVLAAFAR